MVRLHISRGVLNSLSLTLLPDPLWPKVVVPVRVSFMGQIDLLKRYSDLIELCKKKKNIKKQSHIKNVNMNMQWMWFPKLEA